MSRIRLSMQRLAGTGYGRGWWTNNHSRTRCFKGARNTKKSYDFIGLEPLEKIISDPNRNILIVRNKSTDVRKSAFNMVCGKINQPDPKRPTVSLRKFFKIDNSRMIITYRPTGQVIMFGGLYPDASTITSIKPPKGVITDVYVEEAFELKSYDEWRKVIGSIRGKMPKGTFLQITLLFNAWNKQHWIYDHYFKGRLEDDFDKLENGVFQEYQSDEFIDYGKGLYLHTGSFRINEFRDVDVYDKAMAELKRTAPEIYKVEALGMWGNATAAAYPEFNDSLIRNPADIMMSDFACYAIGIDTGLSAGEGKIKTGPDVRLRSATTMQLTGITADYSQLVAIDEYFHSNEQGNVKTEPQLQTEIIQTLRRWQQKYWNHPQLMKGMAMVYVDSADVGFRQGLELEARRQGLFGCMFVPSSKAIRIHDRVMFGRRIMAYGEFIFSTECQNLIREIRNSRQREEGFSRDDIDDHAINANEYGWIPIVNRLKRWKDFKPQG